jgi:cytochrome c-type biogenesis protein CcmH
MLFWLTIALMTTAAAFAVLWPLSRRLTATSSDSSDLAVYRDQLAEIERDQGRGLIGEAEAAAARVEVSRRLLHASERQGPAAASPEASTFRRRVAAVIALVGVPLLGIGLYAGVGNPDLPAQPLAARLQAPVDQQDVMTLIARVERHLQTNPDDGRGFEVLAPFYLRLGRFRDAQSAFASAIRTLGPSPERLAGFAEAAVMLAGGVVTAEAKVAFQQALAMEPRQPRARFFVARAMAQDGDVAGARAAFEALLAEAPTTAGWRPLIESELAALPAAASPAQPNARSETPTIPSTPGPTASDVAAAQQMPPAERDQMIRGMVERLADRLQREGGDAEAWARLVRAYVTLGDRAKALEAFAQARTALANTPGAIERMVSLVRDLGIGS